MVTYCGSFLPIILLFFYTLSNAQTVPAMYVFGDSLVDVGNNDYLTFSIVKANFPYNGIDYPGQKATGRFSNGKNAADILGEKLGLSTARAYLSEPNNNNNNNVFLKGVSFASGGAGIFNTTTDIQHTIPLAHQVGHLAAVRQRLVKEMGSSSAVDQHFSKSLFPIVIGSNDIIGYFQSNHNNNTPLQHVTLMVSTLKLLLKGINSLGARKFLVIGLAPIGCAPRLRFQNTSNECNKEANYWSKQYNQQLTQMLAELKSELNDFHYSYFDAYTVFLDFIQRPEIYGFNETKAACCGLGRLRAGLPCTPLALVCSNRRANIFWDLYHPTESAARMLIDMLFSGSGDHVFPMTVKELIAI